MGGGTLQTFPFLAEPEPCCPCPHLNRTLGP
jgi:hypothetical protein